MLRKYLFRKNFKGIYEEGGETILGHLAFKTRHVSWVNTPSPVLVLLSVNSAFHEGGEGFLKMEAFLSTIKNSIGSELSVLIADTAHFHVQYLLERLEAKENCVRAAKEFVLKFSSLFMGSKLIYWSSLCRDVGYAQIRSHILTLVHSDKKFQTHLLDDAESAFTEKRKCEFPDKGQFIEKTQVDLIEQCILLQVLAKRGYRYLFYPGVSCKSSEYLNTIFLNQMEWIDVFLTIEKKKIVPKRVSTK